MGLLVETFKPIASFAAEVVAETLWPTRCAICDVPGEVLCAACARDLPYLDWWRACRRCGGEFGLFQCCSCAAVSLARIGRTELPYAGCASATTFSDATGRLVRVFKDQGEQRLACDLARMMLRAIPPHWRVDAVTFVPATLAAYRQRGFDHAELIAENIADLMGLPLASTLERPSTKDQRTLSARQRVRNLESGFRARSREVPPRRVLLVDDVYTTGATICSATDALLAAGVQEVRALTFARV